MSKKAVPLAAIARHRGALGRAMLEQPTSRCACSAAAPAAMIARKRLEAGRARRRAQARARRRSAVQRRIVRRRHRADWRRSDRSVRRQPVRTSEPRRHSTCGELQGVRIVRWRPRAPAGETSTPVTRPARPLVTRGQGDGTAAGAEIEHRAAASRGSKPPDASSTSSSVSGRGTSTAGVTLSGSDQNSRLPVR